MASAILPADVYDQFPKLLYSLEIIVFATRSIHCIHAGAVRPLLPYPMSKPGAYTMRLTPYVSCYLIDNHILFCIGRTSFATTLGHTVAHEVTSSLPAR